MTCQHDLRIAKRITKRAVILYCPKCHATCVGTMRDDDFGSNSAPDQVK